MHVLWEHGAANVQTVQRNLKRELAYTTVQTVLNILHRKSKVQREMKDRAYFYKPVVSRSHVTGEHMRDILDRLFGGSAESLVMSLVETKHLTRRNWRACKSFGGRGTEVRIASQFLLTFC